MRLFFFLLFFVSSVSVTAQTTVTISRTNQSDMPAATTVYYEPGKPLMWNDFRGKPEESGNTAALTTSGFGYKMSMGYTGTKGEVKIYVYCYFDKTRSWVKPDKKNEYVLSHEQIHFDISYLAAERFMAVLKKTEFTRENTAGRLQAAYDECSAWMQKQQHDYDRETRNGLSRQEQERWSEKISRLLSEIKG